MQYDRRHTLFEMDQKVWFFNPRKERASKLQKNWDNPYEVVKRLSDVVLHLSLGGT